MVVQFLQPSSYCMKSKLLKMTCSWSDPWPQTPRAAPNSLVEWLTALWPLGLYKAVPAAWKDSHPPPRLLPVPCLWRSPPISLASHHTLLVILVVFVTFSFPTRLWSSLRKHCALFVSAFHHAHILLEDKMKWRRSETLSLQASAGWTWSMGFKGSILYVLGHGLSAKGGSPPCAR